VPPQPSRRLRPWFTLLCALLACVVVPADGVARASAGYARPGGYSRTPSFGGNGGYRTPSTSGGYSRPSPSYARPPAWTAPQSPGDRSFSEGRSSAALGRYRAQQDEARRPRPYAPVPSGPQAPYPSYQSPPRQYGPSGPPDRSAWLNQRGWSSPPQTYYGGNRNFGLWSGLFLGAMLSNLGRPGSVDFFHNNQNDPGYQQWRAEADRQAQDNADLRQKLDELDRQLADKEGQPRNPGALPADVPPEIAKATPNRTPDVPDVPEEAGGSGWVWIVVLAGGCGIAYLAWRRRRPTSGGSSSMSRPPGSPLESAGAMLRHKLSGEGYTPSKFRVGMTLALDPTPFILAAGAIKLPQPEGTGQISVSSVGRVVAGNTQLVRLYLPDGRSLVQLHLDNAGDPDECRLFGTVDEITPADPSEWGAWLDPNEGMIGWPAFQTKDGKTYARVWVPGDTRISPRVLTETIESLSGTRTVQSQAMLYAAPTGAPNPAPQTEYIMVAAVQDGARAWVEVRAGIDLNPVTLQLA
jgi:uncharacterized protein DUF2491